MRILIYGYGRLGKILKQSLESLADVKVYSRSYREVNEKDFERFDFIFLTIPENAYPEVIEKIKNYAKDSIVVDCASTKEFSIPFLKKAGVKFISIHPLFGHNIYPEFSQIVILKDGLWNSDEVKPLYELLEKASFDLVYLSVAEHKELVTQLQTISHFVLLAFYNYFKDSKINTALSLGLRRLAERVFEQNWEVIYTIQSRGKEYRKRFLQYLLELDSKIDKEEEFRKLFHEVDTRISRALILNYCKLYNWPSNLTEARYYLDVIDKLIIDLVSLRLKVGKEVVAEIKKKENKPVYNPQAELRRLNKLLPYIKEKALNEFLSESLIRFLIEWTKLEEYKYVGSLVRVGVLGPIGSFSDEAALRLFGSRLGFIYYDKISRIVENVSNGSIDLGIIPIENILGGTVSETIDALIKYDVSIIAEYWHPINLQLVAKKEIPLEKIRRVYSHPQAIAQAGEFLNKYLSNAEIVFTKSTSEAINFLDDESAAIVSREAALLYGLKILRENIQDSKENKTRFIVISKRKLVTGDTTSLFFTTQDKPGALKEVLEIFYKFNINLRKLESRPDRRNLGKYIFYTEAERQLDDKVLEELKQKTDWFKILGSYREFRDPKEFLEIINRFHQSQ